MKLLRSNAMPILLILMLLILSGCNPSGDNKVTESRNDDSSAQGFEAFSREYEEKAKALQARVDAILDSNSAAVEGAFGGSNSNAEARQIIYDKGDELLAYGDRIVDAVIESVKAEGAEVPEVFEAVSEDELIKSISDYAKMYRNVFDETDSTYYRDFVAFAMGYGSGGSSLHAEYYNSCAIDYFNKMLELANMLRVSDDDLLRVLT